MKKLSFIMIVLVMFASGCGSPSEFQKKSVLQVSNNARYYCDQISPVIDNADITAIEKTVSKKLFEENKMTAEKLWGTIEFQKYLFPKPAQKEAINVLDDNAEWFYSNAVRYIYANSNIPEQAKIQFKEHLKNNYDLTKALKESIR